MQDYIRFRDNFVFILRFFGLGFYINIYQCFKGDGDYDQMRVTCGKGFKFGFSWVDFWDNIEDIKVRDNDEN